MSAPDICTVPGCLRDKKRGQLRCKAHTERLTKHGETFPEIPLKEPRTLSPALARAKVRRIHGWPPPPCECGGEGVDYQPTTEDWKRLEHYAPYCEACKS